MTESLLERSARFFDEGRDDGKASTNPVDGSFHEIDDRIGMMCGFSHVWALHTDAGHVVIDTSVEPFGPMAVAAVDAWRPDAVHSIVYTHGHMDHVGGAGAFIAAADDTGRPRPSVIGHEAVGARFDRYDLTRGYNTVVNRRQFDWDGEFELDWVRPDTTFRSELALDVGQMEIRLRHDRGETDDHAWAWVPERRAVFSGDLIWWNFPNAGNPQKVQRYAAEWADALRAMAALEPELLCPAHGLPVAGRDRVVTMLTDTATALESLVRDTLEMMNAGATLDEVIHTVRVPDHLIEKPYLAPTYDDPEFVVRNIWRLYGGWYGGTPSELKPARMASLAAEIADMAGGPSVLSARALALSDAGDNRLAGHLIDWAAAAAADDPTVHETRAEIYRRRRDEELSLMARQIFKDAAATSEETARAASE